MTVSHDTETPIRCAFVSYSHAADGELAPTVAHDLQQLAKPWYRLRSLDVYVDRTALAVTPELWTSIAGAPECSDYLVLMASPDAGESDWVNREIERFASTHTVDRILPGVTGRTWVWDKSRADLDRAHFTVVPPTLYGIFTEEPNYPDLRWARTDKQLDLKDQRFRTALAELAAPMHHCSPGDFASRDLTLHRRAVRIVQAAVAVVVLLMATAVLLDG